jgi:Flp pilus assembly pilin Flp
MNTVIIARIRDLFRKDESGQALAEYGLILALVFAACVFALMIMGTSIADPISAFVDNLGAGGGGS